MNGPLFSSVDLYALSLLKIDKNWVFLGMLFKFENSK